MGKIDKRANVDHNRTRRLLPPKFVDREHGELRRFDAMQAGSLLVHRPQTEEIGRIGAKALKERMDECILSDPLE